MVLLPRVMVDTRKEKGCVRKGLEVPGLPEDLQVRSWFGTILAARFSLTGRSPQGEGLVICHASAQGAAALTLMKSLYL